MNSIYKAAQQALEVLRNLADKANVSSIPFTRGDVTQADEAIAALEAALAQPESEPAALLDGNGEHVYFPSDAMFHYWIGRNCTKFYTTPQPLEKEKS